MEDLAQLSHGDSDDAAILVRRVLAEVGASYRVLGEAALTDALVRRMPGLAPVHGFLWMETTSRRGAATEGVRWLDASEEKAATSLFDRFFPDSYAQPGRAGVRRWAGVVDETEPLAVAATPGRRPGAGSWTESPPTPRHAAGASPTPCPASGALPLCLRGAICGSWRHVHTSRRRTRTTARTTASSGQRTYTAQEPGTVAS